MAQNDCLAAIKAALAGKRRFTQDDVDIIVEELKFRQRHGGSRFNNTYEEWQAAADEFTQQMKEAARIERLNQKRNKLVEKNLLDLAEEANTKYGDPSLALYAALVGVLRPLTGSQLSVGARTTQLFRDLGGGLANELRDANVLTHFNSGHYDKEIARALEKLTRPTAAGSTDPNAIKIAEVIHKYRQIATDLQNRSGAWIKPHEGQISRIIHSHSKMVNADPDSAKSFYKWRDDFLNAVDQKKQFAGVEDMEDWLRKYWESRLSGTDFKLDPGETTTNLAFVGPGNLARKVSQNPELHFRDADAFSAYNEKYGSHSLREGVILELDRASRHTALLERFGVNPEMMIKNILGKLKTKYGGEIAPQQWWQKGQAPKTKGKLLDPDRFEKFLNVVDGSYRIPGNVSAAKVGEYTRGIKSMASLGLATLSSFADLASKMAMIHNFTGRGIFQSMGDSITSTFAILNPTDRRIAAELAAVGLDGMVGDMSSRFHADDSVLGSLSGWMRVYFKANLLTPWTDGNKAGLALVMGRHLAMEASKDWGGLLPHTQLTLRTFGLTERHWELARRAVRTAEDGRSYLFPDELKKVTDAEMRAAGVPPRERDHIIGAIKMIYSEIAEAGVPTPGAREKAWLTQGLRPGTTLGEALRFVSQFKAFPVTVGYKTMGRLVYSNPDGKADISGVVAFLSSSALLGYASLTAKDLARGLGPRDPTSWETIRDSLTQGGGFGLYGDLILGETSRYGQSLANDIVGPVPKSAFDLKEIWDRVVRKAQGDNVTVAPTAVRWFMNNFPGINLFYMRAGLDYLFLHQLIEASNPGALERRERRIREEKQQSFLLPPPTSVIPYGGGQNVMGIPIPGEALR